MITLTGRDIISKYLIGQTTSFASHIAIGCGAKPSTTISNYAAKTELDFEASRFPITSRNIVVESLELSATQVQTSEDVVDGANVFIFTIPKGNQFNPGSTIRITGSPTFINSDPDAAINANGLYEIYDSTSTTITVLDKKTNATDPQTKTSSIKILGYVPKIVLTAEIPSTLANRYEITEFGLYPSETNTYANGKDSYIAVNFTKNESWSYFDYSNSDFINVPYYSAITDGTNSITKTDKAFVSNAENIFFNNLSRINRLEVPRFQSDVMFLAGDMSEFSADLTPIASSNYISVPFVANLNGNSQDDELRLAFSLINKNATTTTTPMSINIMLEFVTQTGLDSAKYHFRFTSSDLTGASGPMENNRYKVLTLKLKDTLTSQTSNFNWDSVRTLKIYSSVESAQDYSGSTLTDFTICLDAIRFENKSNTNPLYGLVGYTVVNSELPIAKDSGTMSLVEFKFAAGVTPYV